ncbi:hypothetical protein F5I97DRAFT_83475 [Phlebopus sp. FC_14]|nr:hypothetical protein F5I97DRAFT_83475 [Phlebopus sp. FC_14]
MPRTMLGSLLKTQTYSQSALICLTRLSMALYSGCASQKCIRGCDQLARIRQSLRQQRELAGTATVTTTKLKYNMSRLASHRLIEIQIQMSPALEEANYRAFKRRAEVTFNPNIRPAS